MLKCKKVCLAIQKLFENEYIICIDCAKQVWFLNFIIFKTWKDIKIKHKGDINTNPAYKKKTNVKKFMDKKLNLYLRDKRITLQSQLQKDTNYRLKNVLSRGSTSNLWHRFAFLREQQQSLAYTFKSTC